MTPTYRVRSMSLFRRWVPAQPRRPCGDRGSARRGAHRESGETGAPTYGLTGWRLLGTDTTRPVVVAPTDVDITDVSTMYVFWLGEVLDPEG